MRIKASREESVLGRAALDTNEALETCIRHGVYVRACMCLHFDLFLLYYDQASTNSCPSVQPPDSFSCDTVFFLSSDFSLSLEYLFYLDLPSFPVLLFRFLSNCHSLPHFLSFVLSLCLSVLFPCLALPFSMAPYSVQIQSYSWASDPSAFRSSITRPLF